MKKIILSLAISFIVAATLDAADGKPLQTVSLCSEGSKETRLRFSVPAGTKSLASTWKFTKTSSPSTLVLGLLNNNDYLCKLWEKRVKSA